MLLLVHALATLFMTGVIWFVQVVHYPLMLRVGAKDFALYEQMHRNLTGFVVGPPMLIELFAAVGIALSRPTTVPAWMAWAGVALVGAIWASTFLVQVPMHEVLTLGFSPDAIERLVRTNWFRTVAWSVRALIALAMLAPAQR